MGGHFLVVLFSLVCVSSGAERDQKQVNPMPLSYFRSSGLADGMQNGTRFVEEFLKNFDLTGVDENIPLGSNDGSVSIKEFERSVVDLAMTANHAGCNPYDQIITIPNDRTDVLLYPSCVVLKQCGGCCGHPSLACKPICKREKIIQLFKYTYDGSQANPVKKVEYISMEEHTACQCRCKITEEDCDKTLHYLDDWNCKCMCKDERQNCASNKRWDENLCACRCSSVQNCGTGYAYNNVTCRCEYQGRGKPSVVNRGEMTTRNPCSHIECREYYKAMPTGSKGCECKFIREEYLKLNPIYG